MHDYTLAILNDIPVVFIIFHTKYSFLFCMGKSIYVNLKSNYLIHFVFKNLLRKRFSDKIISIVTKDRKVFRKTFEKNEAFIFFGEIKT